MASDLQDFFRSYWKALLAIGGIIILVAVGILLKIDTKVVALAALIAGFITNAFAHLAALIVLIPVAGPLIVKVLSMPVFWLLNGIGYLLSLIAIRKGYGADVLGHRLLTVVLLVGVVIGYVIGNVLPLK